MADVGMVMMMMVLLILLVGHGVDGSGRDRATRRSDRVQRRRRHWRQVWMIDEMVLIIDGVWHVAMAGGRLGFNGMSEFRSMGNR